MLPVMQAIIKAAALSAALCAWGCAPAQALQGYKRILEQAAKFSAAKLARPTTPPSPILRPPAAFVQGHKEAGPVRGAWQAADESAPHADERESRLAWLTQARKTRELMQALNDYCHSALKREPGLPPDEAETLKKVNNQLLESYRKDSLSDFLDGSCPKALEELNSTLEARGECAPEGPTTEGQQAPLPASTQGASAKKSATPQAGSNSACGIM